MNIEIGDLLYNPRYKSVGMVIEVFNNSVDWWNVEWYNVHGKIVKFTEHRTSVLMFKTWFKQDKKWLKEIKVVIEL